MPIPGGSPTSPISLVDLKTSLRINESVDDGVLTDLLASAISSVEFLIGPIVSQSYTESYDGGGSQIVLRHVPVLTVDSVAEVCNGASQVLTLQPVGSAVDSYGYTLDSPNSGIIVRRTAGSAPYTFPFGVDNVLVTYTAGRATLPPDVKQAVIAQARILWSYQQSGRTKNPLQQVPSMTSGVVVELLAPYMLPPNVA